MTNQEIQDKSVNILKDLSQLIGFTSENTITLEEIEGNLVMNISMMSENLGFLIGYHGKNLESFQSVFQLMLNHGVDRQVRVYINVNNYREKREETLKEIAMEAVEFVRMHKVDKHLSPMKANDRRIIHLALKEMEDITTESVGEGEERRVVIKLK